MTRSGSVYDGPDSASGKPVSIHDLFLFEANDASTAAQNRVKRDRERRVAIGTAHSKAGEGEGEVRRDGFIWALTSFCVVIWCLQCFSLRRGWYGPAPANSSRLQVIQALSSACFLLL